MICPTGMTVHVCIVDSLENVFRGDLLNSPLPLEKVKTIINSDDVSSSYNQIKLPSRHGKSENYN